MTALSFKYAYRHVRAGFGRMVLSIIAIALGVALVVAFQLMNAAVLQSFLDTIDAMAGRAQVMVSAGAGLSFSETILDKVRAVPGVKLAVPLVRSSAFPDDGSGEMLTVQGVDLTNESAIRVYHDADKASGSPDGVIEDMVEFLNSPDSIILGREFADKRGLKKGDTLPLVTPNGIQSFTIKGLLDAEGLAQTLRGRIVVMDLFAAERAFTGDGQINQIDVLLDEGEETSTMVERLTLVVGTTLKVQEPTMRKVIARGTVAGFETMLHAFSLLAVAAGFIICYSRLSAVFEGRTWELGILRAVGLTQEVVFLEFLKESILLGSIGTSSGVLLGGLIGNYALPFLAATMAIALRIPVPATEGVVPSRAAIVGIAIGLTAAVTAAIIPASRLSRTQPVAALQMRGREFQDSGSPLRFLVSLTFPALAVAAIVLQNITGNPAYGVGATVLVALTACTAAAMLVRSGAFVVGAIWKASFGTVGALAARQLIQHVRRSTLTVMTLGLGLGLVFLLGILEWSFEQTLIRVVRDHEQAEIVVSSAAATAGQWGAPLSDGLVPMIASIPGVATAVGEQSKEVADDKGEFFLVSYDAVCLNQPSVCRWRLNADAQKDALQQVEMGRGVLVTEPLARRRNVRVGEMVQLESPNGPIELPVVAISAAPMEPAVVMDRGLYRRAWNDETVTFINVVLSDPGSQSNVSQAIAGAVGQTHRLLVSSKQEHIEYFVGQIRQGFMVQHILAVTVFLLVLAALADALASNVLDRTRQFGMLRAVGLDQKSLQQMVLLESGAITLLGLLLATTTGVVLGLYWVRVQFPLLAGWAFDFHFPVSYVLQTAAITFGLCIAGAWLPARRAMQMSVSKALRTE